MRTIKLKVSDKVFDKFVWLLSKFSKNEVEILNEDISFTQTQEYLDKELEEILKGQATFLELDEVEQRLENTIKKHEDCL